MRFCLYSALKAIEVINMSTRDTPLATQNSIIGFRGTSSVGDVIADMQFTRARFHAGKVHSGFLRMYESIDFDSVECPAIVSGHSMGAALAAIHAYNLAVEGHNVRVVYLFAAPKFCNKAFKDSYNTLLGEKTFCIQNRNDVVTRIPPLPSYSNVGIHVDCTFDKGSLRDNHDLSEYKNELLYRYEPFILLKEPLDQLKNAIVSV